MDQTTLGDSGLRIPRVAVGCSRFGRKPDEAEAIRIVDAAIDSGLNFFDTADVYADGNSERILGKAVTGRRDRCIIATKFRHSTQSPGGSRRSIRLSLEGSLRRLNTDYIDLYQMHAPDPTTPIEETVATLQDLVREGKLLYFGLCNVNAWQAVDAQRTAWQLEGAPLVSVQAPMNVIDLKAYMELKPVAATFRLGLIAACPLARGLLGGTYDETNPPPADHPLRSNKGVNYWNPTGLAITGRVRQIAQRLGRSVTHLALAVLHSLPEVACVLVGPSSRKQLIDCAALENSDIDDSIVRQLVHDRPPVERCFLAKE